MAASRIFPHTGNEMNSVDIDHPAHVRIGAALMIVAAVWLTGLVISGPARDSSSGTRLMMVGAALWVMAVLVPPWERHALVTVAKFAAMGLTAGLATLGIFGIGLAGLVPPLLLAVSMYWRRDRLDGGAVIPALIAATVMSFVPFVGLLT